MFENEWMWFNYTKLFSVCVKGFSSHYSSMSIGAPTHHLIAIFSMTDKADPINHIYMDKYSLLKVYCSDIECYSILGYYSSNDYHFMHFFKSVHTTITIFLCYPNMLTFWHTHVTRLSYAILEMSRR